MCSEFENGIGRERTNSGSFAVKHLLFIDRKVFFLPCPTPFPKLWLFKILVLIVRKTYDNDLKIEAKFMFWSFKMIFQG